MRQRALLCRWSTMKLCNKREKRLSWNIWLGSISINQGPEIKVTPTALVEGAGSRFLSMSNIPYQNATWKSPTGVSWIIQGPQPTQVSSALWALRTLRHVHSCYSLQWIQTGSLLSIFITIPSGSVLAGFCNENPAQSTLWHAASSLKIVQWHTAIITHINTLHCAVWRFVPVAWLIPALGTWWDGRKELTFPKRQSSAPGPAPSPWKPIHHASRELAPTPLLASRSKVHRCSGRIFWLLSSLSVLFEENV